MFCCLGTMTRGWVRRFGAARLELRELPLALKATHAPARPHLRSPGTRIPSAPHLSTPLRIRPRKPQPRVLCAAQGQGDRGQGRASTPADRRSLDAVDDAPEGAKVRPGSPGDPSRTFARCCPLLPPLPSLPTTPSWPPPCSAAPPVGRQKTLGPFLDLIDPPCRLWAT